MYSSCTLYGLAKKKEDLCLVLTKKSNKLLKSTYERYVYILLLPPATLNINITLSAN